VAIDHHHRIADAIARHDPNLAAEEMAKHIVYTADTIQAQLARELPPIPDANPTTST
jgi:DNA-binding GntR family transcriptional regulator